ncbi:MAG: hypothetical protein O2782_09335 [bacterium]|nr:hypothetical protein [bacterium]
MFDMWSPRRRRQQRELSAFADGELSDATTDRVAERVVFDERVRRELTSVRRMDALVAAALTPPLPADAKVRAGAAADAVIDIICARLPAPVQTTPGPRNWTPTVVASVGLLVTAGVAFAGLKRRGWV